MRHLAIPLAAAMTAFLVFGCDDPPKTSPPPAPQPSVEPTSAPAKPQGPPEFTVSAEGAKIGWTYLLLDHPDGKQKLAEEVAANKAFIAGKEVPMRVDRQSKLSVVATMLQALEDGGATSVAISTDSRPEYPKSVAFAPRQTARGAPPCSVVAEVLAERKNAVWALKGGTAIKSSKGLAGPDMVVTADHLEAAAKRCKSDFVFISAEDGVEWGLVYDLAAATQTLEKTKLGKVVLLEPPPIAGRPVSLN